MDEQFSITWHLSKDLPGNILKHFKHKDQKEAPQPRTARTKAPTSETLDPYDFESLMEMERLII